MLYPHFKKLDLGRTFNVFIRANFVKIRQI
jgi:hypothetical protein